METSKSRPKLGKERLYNAYFEERGLSGVISWDILPLGDSRKFRVCFESRNSRNRQGIWLKTDGGIALADQPKFGSVFLWYPSGLLLLPSQKKTEGECSSKDGLLSVCNVWEPERDCRGSSFSSGMQVEDLPNGRRYRCHDVGEKPLFKSMVFRIELL